MCFDEHTQQIDSDLRFLEGRSDILELESENLLAREAHKLNWTSELLASALAQAEGGHCYKWLCWTH